MPIQAISYSTIVNTVKNWIKTNCLNISNYNSMHASVKNGYVLEISSRMTGTIQQKARGIIKNGLTGPVASTQVDSDMNSFLNHIGNPTGNVTEDNFYAFINNMAAFCYTNVVYIASKGEVNLNTAYKYLVYKPNNSQWRNVIQLNTDVTNLIEANEINVLCENIIKILTNIEKDFDVIPIQYTFEII